MTAAVLLSSELLAALEAMTPAELERAAARAWDDAETSRLMRLEGYRKQRKAYEAMLAKVNAWAPPIVSPATMCPAIIRR